jgi:transposase
MQKAKREDFRVEEELRSQKIKYEESNDDVYRRMLDIKDTEAENTADISGFLDAQLSYHEKSHEALLHLKNEWPSAYVLAPE